MNGQDLEKVRAMDTLVALSALLGPSNIAVSPAGGALVSLHKPTTKELLAEPMVKCPPYVDPSSVLITDQGTLEFEELDTTCSSTSADSSSESSTKVRFAEMVSIAIIPSHKDMDPDMVQLLWSSTEEVQRNGRRNTAEYEFDGRDWTKVREEEDMIWDEASREYIHPATWEDMELERMHQEHMRRLVQHEHEERERLARAQAAVRAAEALRAEEEAAKKETRKRRNKSDRSPTRSAAKTKSRSTTSPKTSPRTSPRNTNTRKRIPQVVQSASLTRFADT